jgi:protein-disulfide isomerase
MAKTRVPETRRKPQVPRAPTAARRRRGLDRRWWIAIGAAGLAIVAVLVTISILTAGGDDDSAADAAVEAGTPLPGSEDVEALLGGIPQDGESLGEPNAPVTLVVFADPQCPACAAFAVQTLPELIERYVRPGDVRLEYRGVAILGPDSETGLQGAYAAGLQNRLWNLSDVTYLNQGEENSGWLDEDFIRAAAASVPGLDVERVLADRDSAEVEELLAAARADAEEIELRGTPTFQVGRTGESLGEPVSGGDIDTLAELIDPLLE